MNFAERANLLLNPRGFAPDAEKCTFVIACRQIYRRVANRHCQPLWGAGDHEHGLGQLFVNTDLIGVLKPQFSTTQAWMAGNGHARHVSVRLSFMAPPYQCVSMHTYARLAAGEATPLVSRKCFGSHVSLERRASHAEDLNRVPFDMMVRKPRTHDLRNLRTSSPPLNSFPA